MIYSGVDLIRQAESTQARGEKLTGTRAVSAPQPAGDQDPDSQNALMRFARFLNKEHSKQKKRKPVSKPSAHPYARAFARAQQIDDVGQMLNIYI